MTKRQSAYINHLIRERDEANARAEEQMRLRRAEKDEIYHQHAVSRKSFVDNYAKLWSDYEELKEDRNAYRRWYHVVMVLWFGLGLIVGTDWLLTWMGY